MSNDPGTPNELALIAYEKVAEHGFALPCFGQARGANTLYVARSLRPGDPAAPITAFEIYEAVDAQVLSPDKERHGVRIGGPWVDVFLWRGGIYVGTKPEIWLALGDLRDEIEAHAPLSLLNLAEGVPGVASDELARGAFAWLEQRRGGKLAADWQIETYLRGIAIRSLRRRLGDVASTGQLRQELRLADLVRNGSTLTLRLPAAISKATPITPATLSELVHAAAAFGFQIAIAEGRAPAPAQAATPAAAADVAVLVMRLRKGRGGTQTQIPFAVVDGFLSGKTKITSGHSHASRTMTQSSSGGSRNTMKLQMPELANIKNPVARIERGYVGTTYYVYDSDTEQGREIMRLLEHGRHDGTTRMTSGGMKNGTWWRVVPQEKA
jgi:hypothetical protein